MPAYAVTGASGHFGRLVIQEPRARSVPASGVVAVVRTRSKAADVGDRGAQVREATTPAGRPWRSVGRRGAPAVGFEHRAHRPRRPRDQ